MMFPKKIRVPIQKLKEAIYNLYEEILKEVVPQGNKSKTETYEDWAKNKFKTERANIRKIS